ncbi:MAG: LysM peptidoglycan-binding domain-containing protein [Lachnospiraceae bacterium]|nr:LysM peptidoglycan-binding domain-containing protein [Lachnospiraceae bacterium]
MLEVRYKEKKAQEKGQQSEAGEEREDFELPKNVKQVGEVKRERKLYIEDYVMTYLGQLEKNMEETKTAVFLGEKRIQKDCHYLFISGILESEDEQFDQEQREKIEEEKNKYFPDLQEIGWFLSVPGQKLEMSAKLEQLHRNLFPEDDTVLFLRDAVEQEEMLFLMEEGRLHEQSGYYIYYEQNMGMQEYLMDHKKVESVEKETKQEQAVQSFRKKLRRKQARKEKKNVPWIYGASTMLVLAILVIGVTIINNYDKMKNMEEALTNISRQVTEESPSGEIAVSAQIKNDTGSSSGTDDSNVAADSDKAAGNVKASDQTSLEEVESASEKAEEPLKKEEESETEKEEVESESEVRTSVGASEQDVDGKSEEEKSTESEAAEAAVRPSQAVYIVKNGDTLADICQKYYGSLEKVEEICEINHIENQDEIWEGEKIILP